MIKTLREQYDYIIIDAPPLGSVIDAAIITKVCDGTILVVENNVISRRFAQDVKKQIEITGCKILGVIINKYDIYRKGKYKSYYSGYYKRKNIKVMADMADMGSMEHMEHMVNHQENSIFL